MWGCYGRQKLKDCIEMREKLRWKVGGESIWETGGVRSCRGNLSHKWQAGSSRCKGQVLTKRKSTKKIDAEWVNEDLRIVKNVKDSEESDISWSDGAFSLHRGGKH